MSVVNVADRWFNVQRPAILDPKGTIITQDNPLFAALDQTALDAFLIATETCEDLDINLFIEICDILANQLTIISVVDPDEIFAIVKSRFPRNKDAKRVCRGVIAIFQGEKSHA